jgi:NADH-quinone oxidoreductase subunit H
VADAALAALALVVLGTGVGALRAVLDGLLTGTPASIAVLAPLAEGARLIRTGGTRSGARPVLAGAVLLLSAGLRVLVPTLAGPLGIGGFLVADVVWWLGALLLVRRPGFLLAALAVEAPLVLVLAAPAVATRSIRVDAVAGAQQGLPFAATMPVAFLLLLALGGVLLPWVVEGEAGHLGGTARLLVGAALAAQPVATAAAVSVLFLGLGGGGAVAATALLAVVLVVAARRFPRLGPRRLIRLALAVLLPLALVQLAVVVVLAALGG